MKCDRPFCLHHLWLVGAGWFLLALFVGETELLARLPPVAPPLITVALTALLTACYGLSSSFRESVGSWGNRTLVAIHLTRFVGIYFLFLSSCGQLDPRFAVPAGWGDIVVALGAAALLILPAPRWVFLLWNTVGLIDILFVLASAATIRVNNPDSLKSLTCLPLSFLPTVIVPLIVVTHLLLFVRLLSTGAGRFAWPTEIRGQVAE